MFPLSVFNNRPAERHSYNGVNRPRTCEVPVIRSGNIARVQSIHGGLRTHENIVVEFTLGKQDAPRQNTPIERGGYGIEIKSE